jgi:hypothetical protein
LEALQQNSWAAKELVEEIYLKPKLETRMLASCQHLNFNRLHTGAVNLNLKPELVSTTLGMTSASLLWA